METDFGLGRFSPAGAGPRRWSTCPATTSTTTWTSTRRTIACASCATRWTSMAGMRNAGDAGRAAGRHHAVDRLRRAGATGRRTGLGAEETRQGVPRRRLLAKAGMRRHGEPFMAEQMREQGIACQQWLDEALRQPFDGVTVVITHFAPTLASADPRYGMAEPFMAEQMREQGIACQQWLDEALRRPRRRLRRHHALRPAGQRRSALRRHARHRRLLQCAGRAAARADYWLHGHLHCALDYVKDGCRVIANPLGYERRASARTSRRRGPGM